MSFNNLSISRKLGLAFAAVVAIIAAMSAVIFWNIAQLEDATEAEAHANHAVDIITRAEFRLARQENSYRGFLLTNNPYYLERLESHRATFDRHLEELRQSKAGHGSETAIQAGIADVVQKMDAWQREIVDEGKKLAADPIFRFKAVEMVGQDGKADKLMEPIEDALAALAESERAAAAAAIAQRQAVTALTETALYVGVGLAVLFSGILGFLLSRMIATPVTGLTGVMGRLASGDNTVEVPAVERGDEIGEMARAVLVFKEAAIEKIRLEAESSEARAAAEGERSRNEEQKAREAAEDHAVVTALATGLSALASGDLTYRITEPFAAKAQQLKDDFNRTAGQLQETMTTIAEAIGGMHGSTGEISQAADDLSRRTEQQAASLEETAAALDQITATVKKTAEGAHQASEVTGQARVGAEKSGQVVREAVEFIRSTPLVLQIFFVFFGLPTIGLQLSLFWSGVVALALWAGAFQTENVRGGLAAISPGLGEAARALGLTRAQYLRLVGLPLAVRTGLPSMLNTCVSLIKNSAYLSAIGVQELTGVAFDRIASDFRAFEMLAVLLVGYLAVVLSLSFAVRLLEHHLHAPFRR